MDTQGFQVFLNDPTVYHPDQIGELLQRLPRYTTSRKGKVTYWDIPASFDIETTSFYDHTEKRACMYEWSFCIGGLVMIGRTWEQWEAVMHALVERFNLYHSLRLMIYVHNLSFEFGFFGYRWEWSKVFAVDSLKPVYAVLPCGIEYRCSYLMSGYNLATLSKQLLKYPVSKLVGDLDYTLPRHSETPLTDKEIGYCVNDVKVVAAYVQEQIEIENGIAKIPITKTGYARRFCRSKCLPRNGGGHYRDVMQRLTITSDEYKQIRRAFQGGFTHANAWYVGNVVDDVTSWDFTSSYPFVMVSEQYPMSKGELIDGITRDVFSDSIRNYCCIFDVEFFDLEPTIEQDYYISVSRCYRQEHVQTNNGRVVRAESIATTITNVDFQVIRHCYKWSSINVRNFRRYQRGYLPTPFVSAILELYGNKTKLKGVPGKEQEYMLSKALLNSLYGMCATDICKGLYEFPDYWTEPKPVNIEKAIYQYNHDPRRFLSFVWSPFVTAYARKNLWSGILSFGDDYCYSDTDSIKAVNSEKHMDYIEAYNAQCLKKLEIAMRYHKLPIEMIRPKTIKGEEKPLGVWDYDGHYQRFKTLGAKRYMVQHDDGNMVMTVAGLNKHVTMPYLIQRYKTPDQVFNAFRIGLHVPAEHTGKNTHTYLGEMTGTLTDYKGVTRPYSERGGVHLEAADYSMSIAQAFLDFLTILRTDSI